MTRRLRPTDLVVLLGVLVLVAWTPAYLAQDPAEREVGSGITFHIPEPRIGDRLESTLLVTFENGTTVELPQRQTTVVRTPRPNESWGGPAATRDAVLVVESRSEAGHWDLGICTWSRDKSTGHHFYNESGRRVWSTRGGPEIPPSYHVPDWPSGEAVQRLWGDQKYVSSFDPFKHVGERVVYVPSTILDPINRQLEKRATEDGEVQATGVTLDEGLLSLSQRARSHDGHALYSYRATSHTYELEHMGEHFENNTRHPAIADDCVWEVMRAEHERGGTEVSFKAWTWVSPDFPTAVGHHTEYRGTGGQIVFAYDTVPERLVRGEDRPAVLPGGSWGFDGRRPPPGAPVLPTIDVTELGGLETPLHRGTSLPFLVDSLHASGRIDRDDTLTSFIWNDQGDQTEWYLGFVGDETSVFQLMVTDPGGRPQVELIRPFCETDSQVLRDRYDFRCGEKDAALASAPMVSPDALLEEIRKMPPAGFDTTAFPSQFSYLTGPTTREHAFFEYDALPIGKDHWPGSALSSGGPDPSPQGGIAYWSHGTPHWEVHAEDRFWAAGAHRLEDGHPVAYQQGTRTNDMQGVGTVLEPGPVAAASPLSPLHPVPPEIGIGGAILVLFGLLLRLLSWAQAGGHVPLVGVLYAKLRGPQVLDHKHRQALLDVLEADPGLTVSEAAERMELSRNGTLHHLETLRREAMVTTVTLANERRYFRSGAQDGQERVLMAAKHRPEWRAFLEQVEAAPGRTLEELQDLLGRRKSGLSRTGKRLDRFGLVEKRRDGRQVRYYPLTPSSSPASSAGPAPSDRAVSAASRVP